MTRRRYHQAEVQDGKLHPAEVDRSCHGEDLACPASKKCVRRRSMHGDHHAWVSHRTNSLRMQVRKRRQLWLRGHHAAWLESVAAEADRLLWQAQHLSRRRAGWEWRT